MNNSYLSNDLCSVTNTSGLNIGVLSILNKPEQLLNTEYENELILIRTVNGKSIISDQETANIDLAEGSGGPYNLLFVNASALFPLSTTSSINVPYPPVSVTSREKKQMEEALRFYKYMLVHPTSFLTTQFAQVIEEVNELNIESISEFFQNTQLYKNVNLSAIAMVFSYAENYPAIWTEFKGSSIYYLYSSGAKDFKKTQAPNFLGTLEVKQKKFSVESSVIDLTMGYTINFKDREGKTTSMKYTQGVFHNDEMDICLRPHFIKKKLLTYRSQDNVIIPVLAGRINSVESFGVSTEQDLQCSEPREPGLYAFWHPDSFARVLSTVLDIGGVNCTMHIRIKTAHYIYKEVKAPLGSQSLKIEASENNTHKGIVKKIFKLRDKNKERRLLGQIDALERKLNEVQENLGSRILESDLREYIVKAQEKLQQTYQIGKGRLFIDLTEKQLGRLSELAKYISVSPQMQEVAFSLKESLQKTNTALDLLEKAITSKQIDTALQKLAITFLNNNEVLRKADKGFELWKKQLEEIALEGAFEPAESLHQSLSELVESIREDKSTIGEEIDEEDVEYLDMENLTGEIFVAYPKNN